MRADLLDRVEVLSRIGLADEQLEVLDRVRRIADNAALRDAARAARAAAIKWALEYVPLGSKCDVAMYRGLRFVDRSRGIAYEVGTEACVKESRLF
eukprot:5728002-Pleurochrysis_carterae.AAC.1